MERIIKVYAGKCEYCGESIYGDAHEAAKGVCAHMHNAKKEEPETKIAGIEYLTQKKVEIAKPITYAEKQTEAIELNKLLPEGKKIKITLKKAELEVAIQEGYDVIKAASSDGVAESGEIAA